jgi:hypothetical protein
MHNNNKLLGMPSAWLAPVIYLILCFTINTLTGSLIYSDDMDSLAKRNFNAALGMPVITAYLWVVLRIFHRSMGIAIADFLVDNNSLKSFSHYRFVLERKLFRHVVIAATLSITTTLVYLGHENLLALDQNIAILALNVMAIPFWFFGCLYFLQIISSTLYLFKNFVSDVAIDTKELHRCKPFCDLGVSNAMYSLFLFSIVPIFWLGKAVPKIDIVILVVFSFVTISFLIFPVLRVQYIIRKSRKRQLRNIELQLYSAKTGLAPYPVNKMADLHDKHEKTFHMSYWPTNIHQCGLVMIATLVIPSVWFCMFC